MRHQQALHHRLDLLLASRAASTAVGSDAPARPAPSGPPAANLGCKTALDGSVRALCDEHVRWGQPLADLRAERDDVPVGADVALAVKRGKAIDH